MATTERTSATELTKPTASVESLAVTPPVTPNATNTSAHQLVSEIRDIYTTLNELSSLAPSDPVNTLLTRLVNLCVVPYSAEFTTCFFQIAGVEALCAKLRPLCSEAEGELEKYWAERMLAELANKSTNKKDNTSQIEPSDILQTFPYHQNYIDLSRLEASAISAFLPDPSTPPTRIAFLGSGPLPLTSLCFLSQYPTAHIHNIDRDATALRLSAALCGKLGFEKRMSFTCEDVTADSEVAVQGEGEEKEEGETESSSETSPSWTQSQVVFLAALVGTDTHSKIAILASLAAKLRPGCLVVARSAQGVRSVLYPILQLSEDLQAIGLEVLAEVHPWTKVVNSVVVLRVKER
ncbi:nicotianamine synthase [Stemphylium lycopersici]|nr:nicotianamine synthase [Stemphylium lycopersici]